MANLREPGSNADSAWQWIRSWNRKSGAFSGPWSGILLGDERGSMSYENNRIWLMYARNTRSTIARDGGCGGGGGGGVGRGWGWGWPALRSGHRPRQARQSGKYSSLHDGNTESYRPAGQPASQPAPRMYSGSRLATTYSISGCPRRRGSHRGRPAGPDEHVSNFPCSVRMRLMSVEDFRPTPLS